jgi:hypothetical protein
MLTRQKSRLKFRPNQSRDSKLLSSPTSVESFDSFKVIHKIDLEENFELVKQKKSRNTLFMRRQTFSTNSNEKSSNSEYASLMQSIDQKHSITINEEDEGDSEDERAKSDEDAFSEDSFRSDVEQV